VPVLNSYLDLWKALTIGKLVLLILEISRSGGDRFIGCRSGDKIFMLTVKNIELREVDCGI
jgi:hypothetical protein